MIIEKVQIQANDTSMAQQQMGAPVRVISGKDHTTHKTKPGHTNRKQ